MEEPKDTDGKIARVLNGTASEEEKKAVSHWTGLSTSNAFQFRKLKEIWKEPLEDLKIMGHEERKQKIWRAYTSESRTPKFIPVIPFYRRAWVRTAAVLAIILFP